jgi:hypothetical protein
MFSEADAVALRAAIATGALKVRYADGREVTYRSLAEMREILGMINSSTSGDQSRTSVVGF